MKRVAGAVAIAVAVLGACSNDSAPIPGDGTFGAVEEEWTGEGGPTVVVLGDSIVHQTRDALHQALGGYRVRIAAGVGEGWSGGPISEGEGTHVMADVARSYAELDPDIVVLALGTNDALQPGLTLDAALESMRSIVDELGGACIVGVRVSTLATASGFDPNEARAIDDALAQLADETVDIEPVAATGFEPDGVHPRPDAYGAYAQVIADAVGRCAARSQPS